MFLAFWSLVNFLIPLPSFLRRPIGLENGVTILPHYQDEHYVAYKYNDETLDNVINFIHNMIRLKKRMTFFPTQNLHLEGNFSKNVLDKSGPSIFDNNTKDMEKFSDIVNLLKQTILSGSLNIDSFFVGYYLRRTNLLTLLGTQ